MCSVEIGKQSIVIYILRLTSFILSGWQENPRLTQTEQNSEQTLPVQTPVPPAAEREHPLMTKSCQPNLSTPGFRC